MIVVEVELLASLLTGKEKLYCNSGINLYGLASTLVNRDYKVVEKVEESDGSQNSGGGGYSEELVSGGEEALIPVFLKV